MDYDERLWERYHVERGPTRLHRKRLRQQIGSKCAELLSNAETAISGALKSTDGLTSVETMGTGSTPVAQQDAMAALVALRARTTDDKSAFEIFAGVECRIENDHLTFHRKPVSIVARRRDSGGPRRVKSTFRRVRGAATSTAYEMDFEAFKTILKDMACKLAEF